MIDLPTKKANTTACVANASTLCAEDINMLSDGIRSLEIGSWCLGVLVAALVLRVFRGR